MEGNLEAELLGGGGDDEVEYVILDDIFINRDGQRRGPPFNLNNLTDEEVLQNFRFERIHLPRIKNVFNIPDEIVTNVGDRVNGLKALCIVLKRLAYPCRLAELKKFFSMSSQSLSQIIRTTMDIMIAEKGGLLSNLNNLLWLNRGKMEGYAQAVQAKGGAINNCWGFIDGTTRPMCRPSIEQEVYYTGHKRYHCLKYQSILCPDGLIVSLLGAFPGRRHDAGIFRESNIYQQLEEKAVFGEDKFVLYGDQGYGLMELVLTPFPGQAGAIQPHQNAFNQSMKTLRVAVEWGFSKVVAQFAFIDFKKNQELLMQDLETHYKVAVLLCNAHTCLYGSQTAEYFNILPPNLEEYFS